MKRLNLLTIACVILFPTPFLEGYKVFYPPAGNWPDGVSVTFHVNQNGTPDCDGEFDAIERAFQTWNTISTSQIDFIDLGTSSYMPDTGDGMCDIGWVENGWQNLPGPPYSDWGAMSIVSAPNGVTIVESDMWFNGENFTWSAEQSNYCPYNRVDVEDVTAHEAGHWVGLDDLYESSDAEKTMYGSGYTGQTKRRTLESDDIAGASFLYPYVTDWPDEIEPVYNDTYLHFAIDVALPWDPTGKEEIFHAACLEGYQFGPVCDSSPQPFDLVVIPTRVVYGNNAMFYRDIISDWNYVIRVVQIETDGEDNVHAIWDEYDEEGYSRIVYRKRDARTGMWGSRVVLREEYDAWLAFPAIAVAHAPTQSGEPHHNMVYAAWIEHNESTHKNILIFRRSSNGGTSWDSPIQINEVDHVARPQLAIDSTGGVHVVWRESYDGDPYDYLCWRKNTAQGAYGYWQAKVTKQRYVFRGGPRLAIDGYGYVHIVSSMIVGQDEERVFYDRISNLGGWGYTWDSLGSISPAQEVACNPHVVCDNLGFVHFFWDDTRNYTPYPNPLETDIFYRRNFHMGDVGHWDLQTGQYGEMIYTLRPWNTKYILLSDVAQPDTFGDLFVGIDVKWPDYDDFWDVYATLGREDDGIRQFPWPPQPSPRIAIKDTKSSANKPQGCYLDASINRILYFAPSEAWLSCYSIDGRRVREEKVKGVGQSELSSLPSGIYFAHLRSADGSSSVRTKILVIH